MSTEVVKLLDGRSISFQFPAKITFDPGYKTMAELGSAIATTVAQAALPHMRPGLIERVIVRDDAGRPVKSVELPPLTAVEQAQAVGREVAARYVASLEED